MAARMAFGYSRQRRRKDAARGSLRAGEIRLIASGMQMKAARALLGWTQRDLAARVPCGDGGSHSAVKYWERRDIIPTGPKEPVAVRSYRQAFEAAGVRFGSGVNMLAVQMDMNPSPAMRRAAE